MLLRQSPCHLRLVIGDRLVLQEDFPVDATAPRTGPAILFRRQPSTTFRTSNRRHTVPFHTNLAALSTSEFTLMIQRRTSLGQRPPDVVIRVRRSCPAQSWSE